MSWLVLAGCSAGICIVENACDREEDARSRVLEPLALVQPAGTPAEIDPHLRFESGCLSENAPASGSQPLPLPGSNPRMPSDETA